MQNDRDDPTNHERYSYFHLADNLIDIQSYRRLWRMQFFRCASISCTDDRHWLTELTDSLIETGDWQFCVFDSSRTNLLVFYLSVWSVWSPRSVWSFCVIYIFFNFQLSVAHLWTDFQSCLALLTCFTHLHSAQHQIILTARIQRELPFWAEGGGNWILPFGYFSLQQFINVTIWFERW